MKKILILCVVFSQFAVAQQLLKGTVSDESGLFIPGASVILKGKAIGTITNFDGNFSLNATSDDTLVVSYTGYTSKEVKVGSQTNFDVILTLGKELDEVVVTALGVESKKAELSYAVQTVSTKEVNSSRIGDVSKQLRGVVPGLTITSNGGSGVSSSRIVLRGESSLNLNNNQPLIILDGVPISNDFNGLRGANSRNNAPIDYGNGLTDINPDDIADITVLKGPKSAALYGTRAANGALVIRTNAGKDKKGAGLVYNAGFSADVVTRFWDTQNQFSGGFNNSFANYGGWGLPLDGRLQVQPTDGGPGNAPKATPLVYRNNPKDFFNTGFTQNHNLSASFKTDNTYGRISFSSQKKEGIVPNTGYERAGISARIGADLSDNLTLDFTGNYVNSSSDNLPVMGIGNDGVESIIYGLIWSPTHLDLNQYKNGNYWYTDGSGKRTERFSPSWATNPVVITRENLNSFDRHRVFGNTKLTYKITENLSAFARVGIDRYDDKRNSRRPIAASTPFPNGMYREQNIKFSETNADVLLSYKNQFNDGVFGFSANLGANMMHQKSSNIQTRVDQLNILDVYSFGNALDRPVITESDAEKRINSVYGSATLDYDKKVFLDVTSRNDWSSTLIKTNNSFFYPSLGLSGIMSDILDLPKVISFLQVRGSIAQTGNDTSPQLITKTFAYSTLPGSATAQNLLVDPELRPEQTTALEAGFDLRLFENKLKLETNIYSNSTKDQILRVPISKASGATAKLLNAGLVRNSGVEALLSVKAIKTEDFSFNFSLNWSTNRGEIVSLADGVDSFILATGPTSPGVVIKATPGGRMGDIYGKDYVRDDKGNVIWRNVGGIATATFDTELKKVGNYNPDWISGLTLNFSYKGIDLRLVGSYRHGGSLYTETGSRLAQAGKDSFTLDRINTPTVTPKGVMSDGNGGFVTNTIPQPYFNYVRRSRHWDNAALNTFDASFFKLREISLGTDLAQYMKKSTFTKLKVSAFARNVFTYTLSNELRHFDPESFMFNNGGFVPGVESGQLPTPMTIGLNISIGI